mmetsp:Transcript_123/g.264  ORF Transcript_123/g.264 Transcript_123/m.264 type:complete len:428 (+) Transcript_123:92-1375(+)
MWWNTGPHLKRRMEAESGRKAGHTRSSTTFFASKDAEDEFKTVLITKFGSLTRAWRVGLDADENGMLDFREFTRATSELGYIGNIRTLWYLLDDDSSGFISLKELDPGAFYALEKFRALSTTQYDSIPKMWKFVMDKDRSNSVGFEEFVQGTKILGYTDEPEVRELFGYLLLKLGGRFISLEDILFLQKWEDAKRAYAERKRFGNSWVNKDPYLLDDSLKSELQSKRSQNPKSISKSLEPEYDYSAQTGLDYNKRMDDFREFLIKRYGSLAKAFDAMDANESGSLSLVEFQTTVASVLRYCRSGESVRLFMAFCGTDDKDAMISWQELGISRVEWTTHMMNKKLVERKKVAQQVEAAKSKFGRSPREVVAERKHMQRNVEKMTAENWAFNSPLPEGWGKPSENFVPREPPHNRSRRTELPEIPQTAR